MYQVVDRKSRLSIMILVVVMLTLVITVSYAYFQSAVGDTAVTNVGIRTYKSDNLSFIKGDDLALDIFEGNFAQGMGNISSTTTSSAILKANTKTLEATDYYDVYFHIIKNNFEYTTNNQETELLLKVINPDGEYLTEVEGLAYDDNLHGFDITTKSGVILIADNYEILSHSAAGERQDWTFELTFINLDTDQSLNAGKTIDTKIVLTKDDYVISTLSQGSSWSDEIENQKINITNINIVDSYKPTGKENKKWDCSDLKNESVICYLDSTQKIVTIAGNGTGHIFANSDSSHLFSDIDEAKQFKNLKTISGLNILKTTNVTNMNSMFLNAGYNSNNFSINISSWDTSNVVNMNNMFDGVGYNASSWNVVIPPSNENDSYNDITTIYGANEDVYYTLNVNGREFSVASNV